MIGRTRAGWAVGLVWLNVLGAAAFGQEAAVAIIDGRPLSKAEFTRLLTDAYGGEVLQQLILLELSRGESTRRGLKVAPAEVQAEFEKTRDKIVEESGMTPDEATTENKDQVLRLVLDQRGLSMAEFMLGMERNVHLRKCVEADLQQIDEATLREEFARTHGERVLIRHIQIPARDIGRIDRVQEMLKRGAAFGDVARDMSVNADTAARGGELPPFTFDDPGIDPNIREVAFSLKAGEVSSPVKAGDYLHILRLEERIPPDNVTFDAVRAEVEAKLRERVVPQKMAELATRLYEKAQVKVLDGDLKKAWQRVTAPAASK